MTVDITQVFTPTENIGAIAQWINTTFANFDHNILQFYHNLHEGPMGEFLDVFIGLFTRLGDNGIFLILTALVLMLFKKTRKVGVSMIGGVIIGALFTNIAIKNIVARPRPYCFSQTYWNWWNSVGHGLESEFSFPSGHTTSVMAAMTPVFLFFNKKKSWTVFLFVIAIGVSRNYLMVHFPTDILGGLIVGGIAGILSFIIVKVFYDKICEMGKLGNTLKTFDIAEKLKRSKALAEKK